MAGSDNLYNYPLRVVVINQDDAYITDANWQPLPFFVSDAEKIISVTTGNIPESKLVTLIVGFKSDIPHIRINNKTLIDFSYVDLEYIPGICIQPAVYVDKDTRLFERGFYL